MICWHSICHMSWVYGARTSMSWTPSQPHVLQVPQLGVHRPGEVLRERHAVAVVLVVADDALLGRAEEGDLERLVRGTLHRVDDGLEDRALPLDRADDLGLVEGRVLRAVAGRAVRGEAAEVLRDEVEDRLELEAGGLPLVVLRAVAQHVEAGELLLVRADLARVLVGDAEVVAAVDGFGEAAEDPPLEPVRPRERRHRRGGEEDLLAANLHGAQLLRWSVTTRPARPRDAPRTRPWGRHGTHRT